MQSNKLENFYKQREKLKHVNQAEATDPDLMIERLIANKDTFKRNEELTPPYTLPKWLIYQNGLTPAVYDHIWQAVKFPLQSSCQTAFCDTNLTSKLFATSGLPLEVLGHLWSLANVVSPGQLTRQELYAMLALIALVQTGYTIENIDILKHINHPVLPKLDYAFLGIKLANPAFENRLEAKNPSPRSIQTAVSPSQRGEDNSVDEEFTEFQSACFDPLPSVEFQGLKPVQHLTMKEEFDEKLANKYSALRFQEDDDVVGESGQFNKYGSTFKFDFIPLEQPVKLLDLGVVEENEEVANEGESHLPALSSHWNTIPSWEDTEADFLTSSSSDAGRGIPTASSDNGKVLIANTCDDDAKYDVFRLLVKEEEGCGKGGDLWGEEDDDFGDFVAATPPEKEKGKSIQVKCLEACLRILQQGVEIFSETQSEEVLREVFSRSKGWKYFYQLKAIYETSDRFQRKFGDVVTNESLQCAWTDLLRYYKYIPEEITDREPPPDDDTVDCSCKLCECKCNPNYVRYAGNDYHVTCINLFLHFVQDSEISAILI